MLRLAKLIEKYYLFSRYLPAGKRDLNRITGTEELEQLAEQAQEQAQLDSTQSRGKYKKQVGEGLEKLGENDDWLVYAPHNVEAACHIGAGTNWCTSARGERNMFSSYYKPNDQLYVFVNKQDPAVKYQFHYGTQQFMNRKDEPVEDDIKEELEPLLSQLTQHLGPEHTIRIDEILSRVSGQIIEADRLKSSKIESAAAELNVTSFDELYPLAERAFIRNEFSRSREDDIASLMMRLIDEQPTLIAKLKFPSVLVSILQTQLGFSIWEPLLNLLKKLLKDGSEEAAQAAHAIARMTDHVVNAIAPEISEDLLRSTVQAEGWREVAKELAAKLDYQDEALRKKLQARWGLDKAAARRARFQVKLAAIDLASTRSLAPQSAAVKHPPSSDSTGIRCTTLPRFASAPLLHVPDNVPVSIRPPLKVNLFSVPDAHQHVFAAGQLRSRQTMIAVLDGVIAVIIRRMH